MEADQSTEYQDLLYEVRGSVASITLNRPKASNALSMRLRMELSAALFAADSDPAVSVVRLGGAGSSFCAGYDLKSSYGPESGGDGRVGWNTDERLHGWTDQFNRSCVTDWLRLWDLLKPVVVVAQGACLGGGMELLCMADIAYVADDARIGYPPTRMMSTPDVPVFAWKVSMARAKYLQLTGASITGREAAEWGMVAKSVPADQLVSRADAEIEALSSIDPGLLMANKHQVNQAYELMGLRTHLAQAWSWHQLSGSVRPGHDRFFALAREQGLKAALATMNAPFEAAGIL